MKYDALIRSLKPEVLYSPETAVDADNVAKLFATGTYLKSDRGKIQNALTRFAKTHLPAHADGTIEELGKPPKSAWYGWRWMDALPTFYLTEHEKHTLKRYREGYILPRQETRANIKRSWRMPFHLKKRSWFFLALLGFSLFSLGALVTVYSEGLQILGKEGPRAALDYFTSASAKTADPQAEFGKAWSKFSIGKLAEAEQDCYRLIQLSDLPQKVRGNAHFLLGHVQLTQLRLEDAKNNFFTALSIYQQYGKPANLYQTRLGLAEVAIEQDFLEDAEETLEAALEYFDDETLNLGHFYHLKTRIAFFREDYGLALEMSQQSLTEYQQKELLDGIISGLIDIGFYQLLLGHHNAGYATAMQAQELILKKGFERKYYFNLVNILLFHICQGLPVGTIHSQIENRVLEEGTGELQDLLDFVLKWECNAAIEHHGDQWFDPVMKKKGSVATPPTNEGSLGAPQPPPPTEGSDGAPQPPPPTKGSDGAPQPPPPSEGGAGAPHPPPPSEGGLGAPHPPPPESKKDN